MSLTVTGQDPKSLAAIARMKGLFYQREKERLRFEFRFRQKQQKFDGVIPGDIPQGDERT